MATVHLGGRENADAHAEVLNGDLTWAVYSLPPNNELRLQGTGDSVDDIAEEFEDGRVQFGFLRVIDPLSKLPRFVLVQWCGEGVPENRKGLFSSHAATVASRLLKGSHVTIQARSQSDLDTTNIMKRVSNASGSKYSVHNEAPQKFERPAAVGSSYVPVGRPDIASMTAGKKPEAPTPVGTAYQSKKDELADIRAGKQTTPSIPAAPRPPPAPSQALRPPSSVVPPAPRPNAAIAPTSPLPSTNAPPRNERPEPVGTAYTPVSLPKPGKLGNRFPFGQQTEAQPAPVHANPRSTGLTWSQRQEEARRQRDEEDAGAQTAIASIPSVPSAATRPAVVPTAIRPPSPPEQPVPEVPVEETPAPAPAPPPPPPPPPAPSSSSGAPLGAKLADQEADHLQRQREVEIASETAKLDQLKIAEQSAHRLAASRGQRAVVLYDYAKDEDNEMDLVEGEEIFNVEQIDEGWWQGEGDNGAKSGLFPSSYVQLLEDNQAIPQAVEVEAPPVSTMPEAAPAPPPPPPPPPPSAPTAAAAPIAPPSPPAAEVDAVQYTEALAGNAPFAIALYDYEAAEDNEITFAEGEQISDIDFVDEAWWMGTNAAGQRGLYPSNYCQLQE